MCMKRIVLFTTIYLCLAAPVGAFYTNMKASVVVGQSTFTGSTANNGRGATKPGADGLVGPGAVTTDGTKLIIADSSNHRVLIFNQFPTTNGASADVVIGQPDFTSRSANQGGSARQNTLSNPRSVIAAAGKLLISDSTNRRVLVYNQIPTYNNASADVVVGQPDFATTSAGPTQSKLCSAPQGLGYDEKTGKLFIADYNCNRLLIYNSIPTTNGAFADVVVGQTSFAASTGGTSASKLSLPYGAVVINGRLYVNDGQNHRVLVWSSIPTSNGASASLVIGQQNLNSGSANQGTTRSAHTLAWPLGIHYDGRRLFVSDNNNYRVLVYNSLPEVNNHGADIVIGQPHFGAGAQDQGGSAGANTFDLPQMNMATANGKLAVADLSNNRVLIFQDTTNTPKVLFTSSPFLTPDGKLRFSGEVSLSGGEHTVWKVEASVNGGPFGQVTNFEGSVTNPGIPDDVKSKFFHDVAPWDNDNSTEDKWKTDYATLSKDPGYIVHFKAYTNNADIGDPIMHFEPFTLNKPTKVTNTQSPQITFQVNKKFIGILKDTLDHYEVQVKSLDPSNLTKATQEEQWTTYADQIPVSYDLVRHNQDNLLKDLETITPIGNNGFYENTNLKVDFTSDAATLTVTSKLNKLNPGKYLIKVVAIDKYGHPQETLPHTLIIPKPYQYQVQTNKPRVQGIQTTASPIPSPFRSPREGLPAPAPKPSPSTKPTPQPNSNFFLNIFDAVFN